MKQKQTGAGAETSEPADQMMKNYEQALRAGLKLQEEAWQWWISALNQTAAAPDWQKRFVKLTSAASEWVPAAQKRAEEMMGWMEANARSSADLAQKAVEAAQATGLTDSQAKWMEFWKTSMGAARCNMDALLQIGSRTVDSWVDFAHKGADFTPFKTGRAA
jgi:hypothetical protein